MTKKNRKAQKYFFKILMMLCFLFSIKNVAAQQDAQFSHSPFLAFVWNPSFAGSYDGLAAGGSFRSQYTLFNGQPFSQSFYAQMPYTKLHGGFGISLVNDFAAAHRSTDLQIQYAYKKKFSFGTLNAGVQAGLLQYSLFGDKLRASDGSYDDGLINHNDPSLPSGTVNAFAPDLGIGTSLIADNFFVGLAMQHVISTPLKFATGNGSGQVSYPPTIYLQAQYNKDWNADWKISPNILFKSDLVKSTLDFNLLAVYKKSITGGIGFRGFSGKNFDGVVFTIGYQIRNDLFAVYSYDLTTSSLRHGSIGSNEIGVHYRLIPPPPPSRGKLIYCPRFL